MGDDDYIEVQDEVGGDDDKIEVQDEVEGGDDEVWNLDKTVTVPKLDKTMTVPKNVMSRRNWLVTEIADILAAYDQQNGERNKMKFCRWVCRKYQCPTFQVCWLRSWLKRREAIELSASAMHLDWRRVPVPCQAVGQYPAMETTLAVRIRNMRDLGIVVQTWMVRFEAKLILNEVSFQTFEKQMKHFLPLADIPYHVSPACR